MGRVWARYPSRLGQVAQHLRGYLRTLWASEALQEDKVREAFFVTCDKSTVIQGTFAMVISSVFVGVALVTPGEFTLYRIHIHQKSW